MIGTPFDLFIYLYNAAAESGFVSEQRNNKRILKLFTIMSSIALAVFKATIGLVVNKARDKVAEKLGDGDIMNQEFRELIVRETYDIKSKLDGLSRKDLLTSIILFEQGIELLYDLFDKEHTARSTSKHSATTQAACDEAFSFAKEMRKLELSGLDKSATRALSDAKERFKDARREATRAFANEALKTVDRILAMQYQVMATILEKLDNPVDALAPCRKCIEDLHGLSAVQECFNVELTKGLRAQIRNKERRKIIAGVCHVNFVIYSTTLMVCFDNKVLSNWPCLIIGKDKVDPLRDERVAKVLHSQGMEHCCVPWSFGQGSSFKVQGSFISHIEEEHKLNDPRGIATNSSGQFIVADINDVKMFDPNCHFMKHFSLPNDYVEAGLNICDVATDNKDNIYVLAGWMRKAGSTEFVVYEFSNTADLHQKFPVKVFVRGQFRARLTVTNSKVLVLSWSSVVVYDTDGLFVCSFGEGTLKSAYDITAANDGRVMIKDCDDSCVHIFSEDGDYLDKFKLQGRYYYQRIAFHMLTEHVVIAGKNEQSVVVVEIFTKDGEFVRRTQIQEEGIDFGIKRITVTLGGRIALLLGDTDDKYRYKWKVLVI